jgi:hypothetical protein
VGAVGREAAAADATAHVAIADGAGADVALHCRGLTVDTGNCCGCGGEV